MTQPKSKISGVWTAIVTPFNNGGAIDWQAYEKLLALQAEGGIDGIVVCGTTGESPTLDSQEKISLIECARKVLPKTIRVMAGSGSNDTRASIKLSEQCLKAGADSLLIVTPPYNKPNPQGMQAHYEAIAKATAASLCLYHVHHRTGQKLSAEQMASLCEIDGVETIKEASGELSLFSETARLAAANVLSGDDATYLASLAVGGKGVISVLTNIFPKAFVAMHKKFRAGQVDEAYNIHAAISPFMNILGIETNPCPIKAALEIAGIIGPEMRLPMAPVTAGHREQIGSSYESTQQALGSLI